MVLMLWQVMFPPPKRPQKPKAPPAQAASQKTGTSSASAVSPVAQAPTRKAVERNDFVFKGEIKEFGVPFEVTVSNLGGGIERFILPKYKERDKDNKATEDPISLANSTANLEPRLVPRRQMAGLSFGDKTTFSVPPRIDFEVTEKSADRVVLKHVTDEGVEIERHYSFKPDSFLIESTIVIRNGSKKPQKHQIQMNTALKATEAMKRGGGFLSNFKPPPDHLEALCRTDGSVEREPFQGLEDESQSYSKSVQWVGVDRQYFTAAIIGLDRGEAKCKLSAEDGVARAVLVGPEVELAPGQEKRHLYTAYLGVKKASLLTKANADLEGAIDYTILGLNLAPLCQVLLWILAFFHKISGSWGLAIFGLTVLVKLILFPLNQRSGKSMRAMSTLRPQIDALKEKFPDDRQRQSEEMMKLYREHNVSPAGGCLPMLIQMPIWFALYRSLWVSVDLYQQSFWWISDLTTRDPYWILPVTLIVVMFLQQKMTPTTMDPAQQKMMQYTMPLLFGAMMSALPAGLCFYILVNTLLTIVQQHFINKSIGPAEGPTSAQGAPS